MTNIKTIINRLFKRPPHPAVAHTSHAPSPAYRSFNTPASIAAYCDARFDRWHWQSGTANWQHISEPGLVGHLALDQQPSVYPPKEGTFALTTMPTQAERRISRLREGT